MTAVFRHEMRLMWNGLTAYVYGAFFLVAVAIYMMYYNLTAGYANFEYAMAGAAFALIIIIPIITMRIIAEEKKQKTDQLLYSLPVSTTGIVAGKYLAALATAAIPLVIVCAYPLVLSKFGEVYLPTSFGTIFGFLLLAGALMSMGVFVSSITESQAMAAGICFAVMIFNYYMVTLAEYVATSATGSLVAIIIIEAVLAIIIRHMTGNTAMAAIIGGVAILATAVACLVNSSWFEGLLPSILQSISVYERFYVFVNGIFDYTGVIYFISVIVFFLFLTVQSMEKRRYN